MTGPANDRQAVRAEVLLLDVDQAVGGIDKGVGAMPMGACSIVQRWRSSRAGPQLRNVLSRR